jgi:cell shape-determining protein MreC
MPFGAQLNAGDILVVLYGIVAVMLIVVLYHVLFILVDVRKITRRVEDLTGQIETIILKPISMADQIFEWVMEIVRDQKKKRDAKKARKKKGSDISVLPV